MLLADIERHTECVPLASREPAFHLYIELRAPDTLGCTSKWCHIVITILINHYRSQLQGQELCGISGISLDSESKLIVFTSCNGIVILIEPSCKIVASVSLGFETDLLIVVHIARATAFNRTSIAVVIHGEQSFLGQENGLNAAGTTHLIVVGSLLAHILTLHLPVLELIASVGRSSEVYHSEDVLTGRLGGGGTSTRRLYLNSEVGLTISGLNPSHHLSCLAEEAIAVLDAVGMDGERIVAVEIGIMLTEYHVESGSVHFDDADIVFRLDDALMHKGQVVGSEGLGIDLFVEGDGNGAYALRGKVLILAVVGNTRYRSHLE